MKTLFIAFLFAAVSFGAATAAPAETAEGQQHQTPAQHTEADANLDALPQARSQLCLPGWDVYRGSCYYLNNNYESWSNAVSYCANFEATLATVNNILEYNHLQNMAGRAGHAFAWTGGFYFEGDWRWHDGSHFNYQNWEQGSPTDVDQCLQINTQANKGWSNQSCSNKSPSICQIKLNC